MTENQTRQLKATVGGCNRAASQPIPDNPGLDAGQKINEPANIIDLADIMASSVEETVPGDVPG